jgi:hypothetical protein
MPKKKPYTQMTTAQLRAATRQFDDPNYHPKALPWGEKEKRDQLAAAQLGRSMKVGRPRIGLGAQRIQIAMEAGLRRKVDAYARKHHMTRSRLLSEAVSRHIAA